jgi:hypothetical protein
MGSLAVLERSKTGRFGSPFGVWSTPKVAKHPGGVDFFVLRLGGALFAFFGWNAPTDGKFFQMGREIWASIQKNSSFLLFVSYFGVKTRSISLRWGSASKAHAPRLVRS